MIQTNPTFDHFNSIIQTNDNMTSFGKKVATRGSVREGDTRKLKEKGKSARESSPKSRI